MVDVVVRDVPDDVIAALDAQANRLRLSRSAYLRRWLAREATTAVAPSVTVADLEQFARTFRDPADRTVTRGAWE